MKLKDQVILKDKQNENVMRALTESTGRVKRIIEMRIVQGLTQAEIGRELNLSRERIRQIIVAVRGGDFDLGNGIREAPRAKVLKRLPLVKELINKGYKLRAIAEELGVHHHTIQDDVHRLRIGAPTKKLSRKRKRNGVKDYYGVSL